MAVGVYYFHCVACRIQTLASGRSQEPLEDINRVVESGLVARKIDPRGIIMAVIPLNDVEKE